MVILFVNADKIGSKIIQYGTDSKISHCAIQFENCSTIYHAAISKIQQTPISEFFSHYNLVDHVEIKMEPTQEAKVLKLFQRSIFYEGYDWRAFAYFAWDRLKAKFFGGKQAEVNPLDSDVNMICTEVVYIAEDFYHQVTGKYILPDNLDLSITKPDQLCAILKARFP